MVLFLLIGIQKLEKQEADLNWLGIKLFIQIA